MGNCEWDRLEGRCENEKCKIDQVGLNTGKRKGWVKTD